MGVAVYRFDKAMPAAEVRAAAARMALDPNVEYAVPDQVMHLMQTTPMTRNSRPAVDASGTAGDRWRFNLPLAWQRTPDRSPVDSNIHFGHPT
jgi:hypothetical protein